MSTDQSFIHSSFSEATCLKDFQHKLMSSDTWAALINKYCVFDYTLAFNGKVLLSSIILKSRGICKLNLTLGQVFLKIILVSSVKSIGFMGEALIPGFFMLQRKVNALIKQRRNGTRPLMMLMIYLIQL